MTAHWESQAFACDRRTYVVILIRWCCAIPFISVAFVQFIEVVLPQWMLLSMVFFHWIQHNFLFLLHPMRIVSNSVLCQIILSTWIRKTTSKNKENILFFINKGLDLKHCESTNTKKTYASYLIDVQSFHQYI